MSESEIYQYKIAGSSNTPSVRDSGCIFVTGATGLVGSRLID